MRFVGEPVAFVVAEDRYQAEDLAELVNVEYRPLPIIATIGEATADNSDTSTSRMDRQYRRRVRTPSRDAARALSDCTHRARRRFNFVRQAPVPLETRGVVADFDAERRSLTAWLSTQPHYNVRQNLASLLGLAERDVRVIAEDVGGGFGSKSRPYAEEIIVAHASRVLHRPVKWIEDRFENFQATTHSRAMEVDLEIGCDAHGRLRR